ncbi:MAG: HPP family protein [Gemmataceae bacterium]
MLASMHKPFLELTAADLMSRHVVVIPEEMSLRAAAHMLSQAHVSGAPVVDADGRCVGVLSATDFLHWVDRGEQLVEPTQEEWANYCSEWQVPAEELPADAVGKYMTADPVLVGLEASIIDLARQMLDAHIHRLVVVDDRRCPIGIVSSTDLLAAVAYAHERN